MRKILILLMTVISSITVNAKEESVTIKGSVGDLKTIVLTPENINGKIPTVILLHGFTSHKNDPLIKAIAEALLEKGIASVRFDFNGHGKSEGDFQNMTVINEIEDAKLVYEFVRSLSFTSKIAIVGHSQGGVVAALTSAELGSERIRAEVLLSAACVLRDNLLQGIVFGSTFDPLNVPEYVTIFGNKRLGRDYIKTGMTLPIFETAKLYSGEALILHGKDDTIVPYTYSQRLNDYIRYSHLRLIDNASHTYNGMEKYIGEIVTDYLKRILK